MRDPAQALEAARRAAGAGAAEPQAGSTGEELWAREGGRASLRRLAQWAIIDPDPAEVYSTRRLGRPITALKRALIRLMSQYLGQMSAQQSRFNAPMAAHLVRLEERVSELEEELRAGRDSGSEPR